MLEQPLLQTKWDDLALECDPSHDIQDEDDPRVEIVVVMAHPRMESVFFSIVDFFRHFLSQTEEQMPFSMSTLSKEFFKSRFDAHDIVGVHHIKFGNVIDHSTFVNHREVEPMMDMSVMKRLYGFEPPHVVVADFEHDRRQVLLRFPYTQCTRGQERKFFVVNTTIKYSTLKQVIVDVDVKRDGKTADVKLYLRVKSPPIFRRLFIPMQDQEQIKRNLLTSNGDRFVAWDLRDAGRLRDRALNCEVNQSPVIAIYMNKLSLSQCSNILGRLVNSTELPVEFRGFDERDLPFENYVASPFEDPACMNALGDEFPLKYMIEAILSRGAVAKDYILATEFSRNTFISSVIDSYWHDQERTLAVLDNVVSYLDERIEPGNPMRVFQRQMQRLNMEPLKRIHEDDERDGYIRLRKVIVTPARVLLVAPEMIMGNRVLRSDPERYPPDKFLRVVFRDEDCSRVYSSNVGDWLIDRFILERLNEGITVGGRTFYYLGSSNSQLRDNGCYFIHVQHQDELNEFRVQLGSFKYDSVPKMMSRIALCFTQAREVELPCKREEIANSYDYEGGWNTKGEPYTFSDGVGRISLAMARSICKTLNIPGGVPSCFQFRHRGYKGTLVVDTTLDNYANWGRSNGAVDDTDFRASDMWMNLGLIFRPSQMKFKAARVAKFDIVKYSSPVPVCLNRPMINILDQVSAIQSRKLRERICARIHWLLDTYLHVIVRSLIDERKARMRLSEFPRLIPYETLSDINFTQEPFFNSMLRESARSSLKKLRQKLQIPIPYSLGRSMFGVVDDSGELQHGQVFVRYTERLGYGDRTTAANAKRIVLTGPVMITKNPSIVEGDIRILQAVDVPALYHLSDVIVFPRYGPRPHSDEMAGSDLDGDEYTLIWDEQLFFNFNESAFDYTSRFTPEKTNDESELRQKMAQFFVNYVKQDSIGRIANSFLVNSDLYGIDSEVCQNIALKHMEAVDFPKTGKPPDKLVVGWSGNLPPEKSERSPDFMEKSYEPQYTSRRLNGQLFRRIKVVDNILSLASAEETNSLVPEDKLFRVIGVNEDYLTLAQQHYDSYAAGIQNIMDTYGVRTEGELFSGCFVSLRNRLNDKEHDNMSVFNTDEIIERQLISWFGLFRRRFFETFGRRFEDQTVADDHSTSHGGGQKDIFRRVCKDPPDELRKLASAYYTISYDSTTRRLLSFPWLAADVLNTIRRSNICAKPQNERSSFSFDPVSEALHKHVMAYVTDRSKRKRFEAFKAEIDAGVEHPIEGPAYAFIRKYHTKHEGLLHLMFYCIRWGMRNRIFDGPFKEVHLCVLLIQFGLNYLPCETIDLTQAWLDQIDDSAPSTGDYVDLSKQCGGIGKHFLAFVEFLASRQFRQARNLDFSQPNIGFKSIFQNSEWHELHREALETYHRIVFTGRFDALPCTKKQLNEISQYRRELPEVEGEPFVIEIPTDRAPEIMRNEAIIDGLQRKTGCKYIVFRQLPAFYGSKTTRITVSMSGTVTAINELRSMLSVTPNVVSGGDCKAAALHFATQVHEQLMALSDSA